MLGDIADLDGKPWEFCTRSLLKAALERLQREAPEGRFEAIDCDLQDFASVRAAIATIKASCDRLDVLCNNAGVMALKDQATKDGYDMQMQTNCLSHFLLTKELFELLLQSDDARVVNHSSQARLRPPRLRRPISSSARAVHPAAIIRSAAP